MLQPVQPTCATPGVPWQLADAHFWQAAWLAKLPGQGTRQQPHLDAAARRGLKVEGKVQKAQPAQGAPLGGQGPAQPWVVPQVERGQVPHPRPGGGQGPLQPHIEQRDLPQGREGGPAGGKARLVQAHVADMQGAQSASHVEEGAAGQGSQAQRFDLQGQEWVTLVSLQGTTASWFGRAVGGETLPSHAVNQGLPEHQNQSSTRNSMDQQ